MEGQTQNRTTSFHLCRKYTTYTTTQFHNVQDLLCDYVKLLDRDDAVFTSHQAAPPRMAQRPNFVRPLQLRDNLAGDVWELPVQYPQHNYCTLAEQYVALLSIEIHHFMTLVMPQPTQ